MYSTKLRYSQLRKEMRTICISAKEMKTCPLVEDSEGLAGQGLGNVLFMDEDLFSLSNDSKTMSVSINLENEHP